MLLPKIRMADIQITELLYYDPAYESQCYAFCQLRNIDCLPHIGDNAIYHLRDDGSAAFEKRAITPEMTIGAQINIFRPDLLDRFAAEPVQFVMEHGELTGVVHFSDYNQDIVNTFLYGQLAEYECCLRDLCVVAGYTEQDMLAYLQEHNKGRHNTALRHHKKHPNHTPFEIFYLSDLQDFLKSKNLWKVDDEIRNLRNGIMHAHDAVAMMDALTDDLIYDYASFKTFFERVILLHDDLLRLKNRIRFLQK